MTFQKPFAVSAVAAACQRTDNKAPSNTAPSGVYIDALVRPTFYQCLAAVGKLSPKDRRPRPLLAFFDAQNPPGESVGGLHSILENVLCGNPRVDGGFYGSF